MSQERIEDLNLVPPEEGFELYRYKNAEKMRTSGCRGCTGRGRTKQETTRSGPSLRRGKGTLTLEACSRRKPSRDTTRRTISLLRNFLLWERRNESLAPTLMSYEQPLDFVQNRMKVSHICQPVIHLA